MIGAGTIFLMSGAAVTSVVVGKIIEVKGGNSFYFEQSVGVGFAVVALYKVGELILYVAGTFL